MQRVSNESRPSRRISMRARAMAPGALAASLLIGHRAAAQDATPEASPAASPVAGAPNASVTPLYTFELPSFPTAPVSVRLLRMTLEPGASSPMHIHPGPEFDYVISGTLTVNSQGDATVVGATGDDVTRVLSADILTAGDLVVFPAGIGMNLVNAGADTLVIYSAVFHPITEEGQSTTYPDGNPSADAFAGLSYEVLGDGQIQAFPTGATTFSLDEIVVPATSELPGIGGAGLYSMVAGEFGFAVNSGSVQVSRTASPGLRPNAAPDQEFTLAPADAAFFPAGLANATRADQPGELSILRLAAIPTEALSLEVAQISFLPPSAKPENDEGEEVLTEIAIGATVVTTSGSLNLRAEPSTNSNAITQLDEAVELLVIGGPEVAEEYTWWQVQGVEDTSLEGWLASDFLELVSAAPSDGTQDSTGTPEAAPESSPEASPTASPAAGEFPVGQIVTTSEENVRIREDASINAEAINAFISGTEFEITGAPVEADDYTWYPVQLVADESVVGWVVEDFIEVVDAG